MIQITMTRTAYQTYSSPALPHPLHVHLPLSLHLPLSCNCESCICCYHHHRHPSCVLFFSWGLFLHCGGGAGIAAPLAKCACWFAQHQPPPLPCNPKSSLTWQWWLCCAGSSSSNSNWQQRSWWVGCTWKLWECLCIPTWGAPPAVLPK